MMKLVISANFYNSEYQLSRLASELMKTHMRDETSHSTTYTCLYKKHACITILALAVGGRSRPIQPMCDTLSSANEVLFQIPKVCFSWVYLFSNRRK